MSLFDAFRTRRTEPVPERLAEVIALSKRVADRTGSWTMARPGDDTPLVEAKRVPSGQWQPLGIDVGEGVEVQRIGVGVPGVEVFAWRLSCGEFARHLHAFDEQFTVVSGVLKLRVWPRGGRPHVVTLRPGQSITVPAGTPHEGIDAGPYVLVTVNRFPTSSDV